MMGNLDTQVVLKLGRLDLSDRKNSDLPRSTDNDINSVLHTMRVDKAFFGDPLQLTGENVDIRESESF